MGKKKKKVTSQVAKEVTVEPETDYVPQDLDDSRDIPWVWFVIGVSSIVGFLTGALMVYTFHR